MRRIATAALSILLAFSMVLTLGGTASANALAGGGYSSSYSGESVFTNQPAGGSGQFSAIFFNDGTQPWAPGVVGLLVCLPDKVTCNVASPNAAYASGWFSSTVYATVSATVAPGQNGFFVYNFMVPAGTAAGTAATFNGDVGLIATGAELRPEGYYQTNTTPSATGALTISPTSASLPVGGQQQFTVTGAPAGSTVSWNVIGGCGAITNTGLFAATASNSTSQPCSVTASAGGLSASANIIVFGPGSALVCKASPSTVAADGGGTKITVTATLVDASGNVVSNNSTDSIAFTNNTPSILQDFNSIQPSPRTLQNGVATKNVLSTTTAGTGVISFNDTTNTSVTGCSATITTTTPGTGVQLGTGYNLAPAYLGTITADGSSTSWLEFDVLDANGVLATGDNTTQISIQRVSGASVCAAAGSGSAGPTTVSQGAAYFLVTSTTTPGTCSWTATSNNSAITSSATATLTTVLSGSPNQLTVQANRSPQAADGVATLRVTIALKDASGNPITTSSVAGAAGENVTATLGSGCSGTKADGSTGQVTFSDGTTAAKTVAANSYSAKPGNTTNYSRFVFKSTYATTCTVTFSSADSNVSSVSANITFTALGASGLACSFSPTTGGVAEIKNDGASTAIATISTVDANNNLSPLSGVAVSFSKTTDNSATTLQTSSPQTTGSGGTVTFTVKSTTTAATDTYRASATISGNAVNSNFCTIATVSSF